MKNWWYSLCMLVVYLGVFKFWALFPNSPPVYKLSGLAVTALLIVGMIAASSQRYFAGLTDTLAHWLVVLDVFLEAIIAVDHPWIDGLWCAVAFAVVIGGYRYYRLHRAAGPDDVTDPIGLTPPAQ